MNYDPELHDLESWVGYAQEDIARLEQQVKVLKNENRVLRDTLRRISTSAMEMAEEVL